MATSTYTPKLGRAAMREVTLDDGTKLKVRKLTAGEVETCRKDYGSESKTLAGLRFIACRVTHDEQGNRLWTDAELLSLVDEPHDDVQAIATAALEFSGVVKADPKKPSGDSEQTPAV